MKSCDFIDILAKFDYLLNLHRIDVGIMGMLKQKLPIPDVASKNATVHNQLLMVEKLIKTYK